jgi:diacylglycerol kinase
MGLKHSTIKSFSYAYSGVKTAIKNEPNMRIHIFFAVSAIALAAILQFSVYEWILLTLTIFFVIMLELINTVLEALVNLVSPEIQPEAKIAKDVSAAAVLFAAFISIVVGLLLFGPKLIILMQG